jgi:hypothetical protein
MIIVTSLTRHTPSKQTTANIHNIVYLATIYPSFLATIKRKVYC